MAGSRAARLEMTAVYFESSKYSHIFSINMTAWYARLGAPMEQHNTLLSDDYQPTKSKNLRLISLLRKTKGKKIWLACH